MRRHSRGAAVIALGMSTLVAGAVGWAGIEVARRQLERALNPMTGDIRALAQAMPAHAEERQHVWLLITLIAGVGLVVLGVITRAIGRARRPA